MKLHGNAALSWQGRRRLAIRVLEEGWTVSAAAAAAGVSVRCARKWVVRYREEGERGLHDRSSAPKLVANRTSQQRVDVIIVLRRLRFSAAEIAEALGMALSTVSVILRRVGMGRLGRLGLEQPVRYERTRPGELVHVDVKKLAASRAGRAGVSAAVTGTTTAPSPIATVTGARPSATSTCTSRSTTSHGSPTRRCSKTRRQRPRSASSRAVDFYRRHGIRSSASSATTAPATAQRSTPWPANTPASATYELVPTGRKPTAKQNASSAPSCTAGPTAQSTHRAANAPPRLTAGSGTTTIADDTQRSATNPRPPEPTCLGPTSRQRAMPELTS